ncbi:hypothetical protein [Paenibacillus sp. Marseille-Q7038]
MKMRGLTLLIVLIFLTTGCSNHTIQKVDSPAGEFLTKQGYEIIRQEDKVYARRLQREDLTQLPHQMYWSVQSVEAASYIGKMIFTSQFYVKNHPLDQAPDNPKGQTIVYIMQTENEVIGGYSLPDSDVPVDGWVYSLDGRTLEEFSGLNYGTWKREWDKKYK